jgi:prepilin-type N-terminal cleavage/methylation domain-containing protein
MSPAFQASARQGGFTLIEVLVAMVVLSVGVLSLARMTGGLAVEMRRAGAQTMVIAETQTELELTEVQDFVSVAVGTAVDTVWVQGRAYVRTVTVTAAGARVKRVDVVVAPAGSSGPTHSLTSYVHKAW